MLKNVSIDNRFLYYLLTSTYAQNQIESSNSGGATPALTQEKLGNIKVVLPSSTEEQEVIRDYLNDQFLKFKNSIESINKSIERLKEYREALITSAVTGQIDVRKEIVDE